MIPLICVLTVTVASGVTVPKRGNAQLNVAGCDRRHRHGYRPVLPAASAALTTGRGHRLLVLDVSGQRDHEQHDDDDDEQGNPVPTDECPGAVLGWRSRHIVLILYH